jgi:hypothetical protein
MERVGLAKEIRCRDANWWSRNRGISVTRGATEKVNSLRAMRWDDRCRRTVGARLSASPRKDRAIAATESALSGMGRSLVQRAFAHAVIRSGCADYGRSLADRGNEPSNAGPNGASRCERGRPK